jgi:hypothetical protein
VPICAGQDIDAGAGAVRHDDGDRAACDLGGGGKEGNCYQKKRANSCAQHLVGSDDTFHCFLMLGGPISEPRRTRRIAADRAVECVAVLLSMKPVECHHESRE